MAVVVAEEEARIDLCGAGGEAFEDELVLALNGLRDGDAVMPEFLEGQGFFGSPVEEDFGIFSDVVDLEGDSGLVIVALELGGLDRGGEGE